MTEEREITLRNIRQTIRLVRFCAKEVVMETEHGE